ncbi:hypothetical protein JDV02_001552 [Purpureocillium takamizusanense]|uniref:Uncharacterized protein n=1 Tax=Purpureocillium takamizusanense TaxID=2060973 RepID=A0A9Q8Q9T6_9HYPO|nr:uncharacterized protein JDV02_001552 [Purpureocillium takamizusanense]UNI14977.1 hypothetical protein JDV02_001552 [Purpureocillium takamizusanense]
MVPAPEALGQRAADAATCPKGTAFYRCDGNDFLGCCSVDPCDLPTCPDGGDDTATASAPVTLPTLSTSTKSSKHTSKTTESSSERPRSTITLTASSTSKRTDSGITHTIPNSSVVTVTRHTTIFSEAPSSTTDIPSLTDTASLVETPSLTKTAADQSTGISYSPTTDTPAASSSSATTNAQAGSVASGTIVAVAVGGTACLAIIVVLIWGAIQRQRKQRLLEEAQISNDFVFSVPSSGHGPGRDDASAVASAVEKQGPQYQHASPHTTGRPVSTDPFAPFGGRVDRPQNQHRSGTDAYEMSTIAVSPVEMDGRGVAAPAELPAEAPVFPVSPMSPADFAAGGLVRPHSYHHYSPGSVPTTPAADPRANLSSIQTQSGRAGYVNQWDQWRTLGGGGSGSGNDRAPGAAGGGRS